MTTPTELAGWKEIAYHLRVSHDTAERWSRRADDPLPVYWHRASSHVYARTDEIDAWQRRQLIPLREAVR